MTTKKQIVNSLVEDLSKKTKEEILEIITTQSGDLVSKAMEIAKSRGFLGEAIVAAAKNNKREIRNWAVYYVTELLKSRETKEVLEKLKLNNDPKVVDAACRKWRMLRFDRKIKVKV